MFGRRNNFSKIHLLSTVILIYLSMHVSLVQIPLSVSLISTNTSIYQSYMVHDSINITNDGELAAVANSGIGTANDPYIITGWNITRSPTDGISILGTTKYVKIENCWIESSVGYGIYMDSFASETTTIINNICNSNGRWGIFLKGSDSSIVTNNT